MVSGGKSLRFDGGFTLGIPKLGIGVIRYGPSCRSPVDAPKAAEPAQHRGPVPPPPFEHPRPAPRVGSTGRADRLVAVRAGVRRALRRAGPARFADPIVGRSASAEARQGVVRRAG